MFVFSCRNTDNVNISMLWLPVCNNQDVTDTDSVQGSNVGGYFISRSNSLWEGGRQWLSTPEALMSRVIADLPNRHPRVSDRGDGVTASLPQEQRLLLEDTQGVQAEVKFDWSSLQVSWPRPGGVNSISFQLSHWKIFHYLHVQLICSLPTKTTKQIDIRFLWQFSKFKGIFLILFDWFSITFFLCK